ncbi:MAG: bifunctional diaminohydroxyphosphoribosylaminopyrimidine deaminase/5-amino-6-(5-phosphoribosylamino)uracil reductase RibD, partial [Ectothiorhodospiraceae bacterium]
KLAERGLYTTDPNPRVGCVVVRDGVVVGEGWHQRAGEPHAEVHALRVAGDAARGATVYVTLEPCSHHGRTPPCAEALADAGVHRVVAAAVDPNPEVAGTGLDHLRAAGIETASGLMTEAAWALNPGFRKRMSRGLPYVRVKLAASLDGRTAMASGESKWITGAAARADVHRLRARSSAIVTGIGTVLADDPRLTARDVGGEVLQPRRVILDSWLRTPPRAQVLQGGATILYSQPDEERLAALDAAGAELWPMRPGATGRVEPVEALAALARHEVNEIIVEAGPTLSGALMQEGLVDELVVYLAPHLMGHEGNPLLRLPGLSSMADRVPVSVVDMRRIGEDLRIVARPGNDD